MKTLLLIFCFLVVGCAGYIKHTSITTSGSTVTRTRTVVKPPFYPKGDSYLTYSNLTLSASVSGAQSQAGIAGAAWKGKGLIVQYGFCGLLLLLGGWCIYSKRTSTKVGLVLIGSGLAGFAVVQWVSASASVMSWVLPVLVVAGAGYFVYAYVRKSRYSKL